MTIFHTLATAALLWIAMGWSAGLIAIAWGWSVAGAIILAAWLLMMAWCLGKEWLCSVCYGQAHQQEAT